MTADTTREAAAAADAADPLAAFRSQFVLEETGPIYLDGNSLGRMPTATAAALSAVVAEWGRELIAGWDRGWLALPGAVGDEIAPLLGASPGEVVVSDSTTVNLYKCAVAALDAAPDRRVIVAERGDFPTLGYVLQGIAAARGLELRLVDADRREGLSTDVLEEALGDDVGLCCLSAVDYRSGARLDLAAVAAACRRVGALLLLDASHGAGAIALDLPGAGVDLAVGCSYKYLNGGPGSPAWLYVPNRIQDRLRPPIWGWWGRRDMFAMEPDYDPAPGATRFLAGTAAVLGLTAVRSGVAPLVAAGMAAIEAKTRGLVALLAALVDQRLAPLGARLASPADPTRRGGHLAVSHPHAAAVCAAAADSGLVVADFRRPDLIRLAPVALYTRFVDVVDAVDRLASVLAGFAPGGRAPVGLS